jgi:hypothetical protein
MKLPLSRVEAGLPEKGDVVRLLYNRAATQTVVEMKISGGPPRHRLYSRSAEASSYELVGTPTEDQSFEQAATCEAPILFFSAVEWRKTGERIGGTHIGIFCAELTGPKSVRPIALDKVLPQNAWIRSLLRALDSGRSVDVVVAFKEGGPSTFEVRYAICRIDLDAQSLVELSDLPGVFF